MEKTIIQSATKISLLVLVFSLTALSIFAGVWGVIHGTLDPKEIITLFGTALTLVLGAYFGSKFPASPSSPSVAG